MNEVNELGSAIIVAIAAGALALVVRELLLHYSRRLSVERDRIIFATDVLRKGAGALHDLLQNDHVPSLVKDFLLEISRLIVDKRSARPVADWVEAGCKLNKIGGKFDGLMKDLEQLQIAEPWLYEDIVGIIRGMIVTLMHQWHETRVHYDQIASRLATFSPAQSIDFAIALRMAAGAAPPRKRRECQKPQKREEGQKPEIRVADCAR